MLLEIGRSKEVWKKSPPDVNGLIVLTSKDSVYLITSYIISYPFISCWIVLKSWQYQERTKDCKASHHKNRATIGLREKNTS